MWPCMDFRFSELSTFHLPTSSGPSSYWMTPWYSLLAVHTCLFTSTPPPINFPQQFTTIKIQDPSYSLFSCLCVEWQSPRRYLKRSSFELVQSPICCLGGARHHAPRAKPDPRCCIVTLISHPTTPGAQSQHHPQRQAPPIPLYKSNNYIWLCSKFTMLQWLLHSGKS